MKSSDDLNWINFNNQMQIDWSIRYLRKAGIAFLQNGHQLQHYFYDYQTANMSLEQQQLHMARYKAMKQAWRKYANRQAHRGRKSYSFEMSASIGARLNRISRAAGQPANYFLESLINDADAFRKRLEQEKKDEIAKIRQRPAGVDGFTERQKQQLIAQSKATTAWKESIENLLTEAAQYETVLRAMGIWDKVKAADLTVEQRARARLLADRWKAAISKSVKARLGIGGLFLDP